MVLDVGLDKYHKYIRVFDTVFDSFLLYFWIMRLIVLQMNQLIEAIAGSMMIMLFVVVHHRNKTNTHYQKHTRNIFVILAGSIGIWVASWIVRKISVNIYHSYLQATNQREKEFIVHLPFLYDHDREHDSKQFGSIQHLYLH